MTLFRNVYTHNKNSLGYKINNQCAMCWEIRVYGSINFSIKKSYLRKCLQKFREWKSSQTELFTCLSDHLQLLILMKFDEVPLCVEFNFWYLSFALDILVYNFFVIYIFPFRHNNIVRIFIFHRVLKNSY